MLRLPAIANHLLPQLPSHLPRSVVVRTATATSVHPALTALAFQGWSVSASTMVVVVVVVQEMEVLDSSFKKVKEV